MARLILHSGAVTYLANGSSRAKALMAVFASEDLWPPVVPSAVLVECVTGHPEKDVQTNRFLQTCDITGTLTESRARRAARLRTAAGCGSAVDAIVVAVAEPRGLVVTGDKVDLTALAANAIGVRIERI